MITRARSWVFTLAVSTLAWCGPTVAFASESLLGCFESTTTKLACAGIADAPVCSYTVAGSSENGVINCSRKAGVYECGWARGKKGGGVRFAASSAGFAGKRSDGVAWNLRRCPGTTAPAPSSTPSPRPAPTPSRAATQTEIKDFLLAITGASKRTTPVWLAAYEGAKAAKALVDEAKSLSAGGGELCALTGPLAPLCGWGTLYAKLIAREFSGEGQCAIHFALGSAYGFADWTQSSGGALPAPLDERCFVKGHRTMIERLTHARDGYLQTDEGYVRVPALAAMMKTHFIPLFRATSARLLVNTAYQTMLVHHGRAASMSGQVKLATSFYTCLTYPKPSLPPKRECTRVTPKQLPY